jgi:uncharacterized protein YfdQ (DUF2303 family)
MDSFIQDLVANAAPIVIATQHIEGRQRLFVKTDYADVSKFPFVGAGRKFSDLPSFINYVVAFGTISETTIFVSDKIVLAFLNERWREGEALFALNHSLEYKAFVGAKTQKQMIDLLDIWGDIINTGSTINDVRVLFQRLKIDTKINYESSVSDGIAGDISVSYEDKTGGGVLHIPTEWIITMPIYEGTESIDIALRLKMTKPNDDKSRPLFSFEHILFERDQKGVLQQIVNSIQNAMVGWKVFLGSV